MATPLGQDTITIVRAPLATADRYRQQTRDWTSATRTTVTGCLVQMTKAKENDEQREFTTTLLVIFAPPGTDAVATDRVEWNNITWEVRGDPFPWHDTNDRQAYVEIQAVKWAG